MTDFDLLKLPNLILRKIPVSQSEKLCIFNTFKCGISSKKRKFRTSKMAKVAVSCFLDLPNLLSHKICVSQSANCKLASPRLYTVPSQNSLYFHIIFIFSAPLPITSDASNLTTKRQPFNLIPNAASNNYVLVESWKPYE